MFNVFRIEHPSKAKQEANTYYVSLCSNWEDSAQTSLSFLSLGKVGLMTLAGSAQATAAGRWTQLIRCNAALAQRLKHLLRYPFSTVPISLGWSSACHRVFAAAEFVVLGREDSTAPGRGETSSSISASLSCQRSFHKGDDEFTACVCVRGLYKLQAAAHRGDQKPGGGREIRWGSPAVQMPACKAARGGATGL